MNETAEGKIQLNVGGMVYMTSKATLTKDSDSMLAAMFSGRHEVKTEKDGSVFLDRDGTHFRYQSITQNSPVWHSKCAPIPRVEIFCLHVKEANQM